MSEEEVRALIHDLRTPLTVVEGFAKLLERGSGQLSDEEQAEYVERILEGTAQLRSILDAAVPRRTQP